MIISLNCLIFGQDTSKLFNVPIGQSTKINDVNIDFNYLIVVNFKDIFFGRRELLKITAMDIWKFEHDPTDLQAQNTTQKYITIEPTSVFLDNLGGTLLRAADQLTSNINEGISLTDKDTNKRQVIKS
ncbi:hypothetical protein GLOIN_2v1808787 [Rhizophagus clarus]|uniref:Uncharacterized protein n=1 Tax=Rhizophagus clarus TaxID=94130 RepID=A0A8H3LTZ6_9GLOM|nr:hypothetical protein GLOIN_2v1808787 [Rhizophagus clarus]